MYTEKLHTPAILDLMMLKYIVLLLPRGSLYFYYHYYLLYSVQL